MVQRVQENGAADLWSFELEGYARRGWRQSCKAMRVGWLDVPRQPTLRGEWSFDIWGLSPNSDAPLSTCGASLETDVLVSF